MDMSQIFNHLDDANMLINELCNIYIKNISWLREYNICVKNAYLILALKNTMDFVQIYRLFMWEALYLI